MHLALPTGRCVNPACSLAARGDLLERYPGPGEYCPGCGERLVPLSPTAPRQRGPLAVATAIVAAIGVLAVVAVLHPPAPGGPAAPNDITHRARRIALVQDERSCGIALLRPACSHAAASRSPAAAEVPELTTAAGAHGDMQLGAYAMTAAQMLESAAIFTQPASRAFFRDVTLRLADCQPSGNDARRAREIAERFLTVSSNEDWNALRRDWRDDVFYRAVPRTSKRAFVLGIDAVQIAHLAVALRDPRLRDDDLSALRALGDFDAALPGIGDARRATLAARDDWHALNASATQLVLRIVQ